jgi:putative transposase
MRLLNQRYVGAFNRRHHRTGTLWESRFRSCLVDTEAYLLTLYRYIEMNPVRAAMVDAPQRYRWSSARANLGLAPDPCLLRTLSISHSALMRSRAPQRMVT